MHASYVIRRLLQIRKHLGLPGHPIRNFGTGNYESLTDMGRKGSPDADEATVLLETRRRLAGWWEQQYCAGRMVLAVIGKGQFQGQWHPVLTLQDVLRSCGLVSLSVATG